MRAPFVFSFLLAWVGLAAANGVPTQIQPKGLRAKIFGSTHTRTFSRADGRFIKQEAVYDRKGELIQVRTAVYKDGNWIRAGLRQRVPADQRAELKEGLAAFAQHGPEINPTTGAVGARSPLRRADVSTTVSAYRDRGKSILRFRGGSVRQAGQLYGIVNRKIAGNLELRSAIPAQ